jgi:hypothetical protein
MASWQAGLSARPAGRTARTPDRRPQWIRELAERIQLDFVQLGAPQSDASLTENPWDQHDHIVVSRDFLRTERAREAFEAAEKDWDLAVIDEAHGFTIAVDAEGLINKKSERYKADPAPGFGVDRQRNRNARY